MIDVIETGALWTLVLNRADKANALTRAMLADLAAGVGQAVAAGAQALVITGAGKVFSAGADLDEMQAGLGTAPEWETLSSAIAAAPCLTIAALNGTLAGGAFGMALACDLRVAVPSASFFYPVMKRGYLPQRADPKRMAALIGPARAKMILMAGARISAEQALDWGLVDRVSDDLTAVIAEWTADPLAASPAHVAAIKAMF